MAQKKSKICTEINEYVNVYNNFWWYFVFRCINETASRFIEAQWAPKGWEQVSNEPCSLLTHRGLPPSQLWGADSAAYFRTAHVNLFVHRCKGRTRRDTLIQMCHSTSLRLLSGGSCKGWNRALTIRPLLDSSITPRGDSWVCLLRDLITGCRHTAWSHRFCVHRDLFGFQPDY